MRRARDFSLGALVVWAGCGPAVTEERELPQTCGEDGAVRLLDDLAFGVAVFAGERLLVQGPDSLPLEETTPLEALTLGGCGEDPASLEPSFVTGPYGAAGPYVVQVTVDGEVSWVDPLGEAPNHVLFEDAKSCLLPVAGGLAALESGGRVVFHPDPSRADVVPRVLVEHAVESDFGHVPLFYAAHCDEFETRRPVVDGDGILVAEEGGPLLRFSLPGGESETVLAGPVGEFVLLDDPRYILWRDDEGGSVEVFNREAGTSTEIHGGTLEYDWSWQGSWVWPVGIQQGSSDDHVFEAHNYVTGADVRLNGPWELMVPLSSTKLLLRNPVDSTTNVFDTDSGQLREVDFPEDAWPVETHDDGVVGLRTASPEATRGDLVRLPFDTLRPTVQAEDVPAGWVRTHGGNVLFIDRDEIDERGRLILVERDGRRRELATDVSSFNVPHHGTDHERNEVFYFVAEGDDRGMWRLVLP